MEIPVMKRPIQPIYKDKDGRPRFLANNIVVYLKDLCETNGLCDMNKLARIDFSRDDREQFAQLIGYSLSGFGELSYVGDETYSAAYEMFKTGKTEEQARLYYQRETIAAVKSKVKELNEILGKGEE